MADSDFRVRQARPDDLPAAAALGAELVRFHHALDPGRFAILADPLEPGYARFLAGRLSDPNAVVLVAEVGRAAGATDGDAGVAAEAPSSVGKEAVAPSDCGSPIIGYAFGQIEPRSWADLLDTCGRIHDLIVQPAWRGRGIGKALARAMIERLRQRGAPRIVLAAAWANPAARRLFESLGFRPTMVEMTLEG